MVWALEVGTTEWLLRAPWNVNSLGIAMPLVAQIGDAEVPERLSQHVNAVVARRLEGLKDEAGVEGVRGILGEIGESAKTPAG
ncbi:hypothetical protein [Actinomyces haliotis]|uniref:hypothetical protein n=1 Tax=Actinomyces haliotis TaxID=1280843 RepID=UPI0018907369|nr:hypothetical protein [Actinomyces haliotis]